MDDLAYLLAVNLTGNIGPIGLQKLKDYFRSFEKVWFASSDKLAQAGLLPKQIEALRASRKINDPAKSVKQLSKHGMSVVVKDDPKYPQQLLDLHDPPYLLYILGKLENIDSKSVAIVGTRRPSNYGRQVASDFATSAVRAGLTTISGLALGIDSIVHKVSVDNGARTVAVLAGGLDQIYPTSNTQLARAIIDKNLGAMISEYPPGTPCYQSNFPVRNRIIAGLARSVLIPEAGENSGSIHTATAAINIGRDVYVVPGSIYNDSGKGSNLLMTQGAIPVLTEKDWLQMMGAEYQSTTADTSNLSQQQLTLLQYISKEPIHADELARQLNLPISQIVGELAQLELVGQVKHLGAMRYTLVG